MTETVFAVLVTHRRRDELAKSLDALTTQSRVLDHLIAVTRQTGHEATDKAEIVAELGEVVHELNVHLRQLLKIRHRPTLVTVERLEGHEDLANFIGIAPFWVGILGLRILKVDLRFPSEPCQCMHVRR